MSGSRELDSPLDRLTTMVCRLYDMPHAMIAVIDGSQTVFRSNVGLGQAEMRREVTATDILVAQGPGASLIVPDAREHPTLRHHPLVVGEPWLRFFAGATISNAAGEAIGAVGVMDIRPHPEFDESQMDGLAQAGALAVDFLERAEESRRMTERLELLRLAEEMAGVGQWRLDAETLRVTWSDEVYRIHGVTRDSFDPSYDDAIGAYHPDDQPVLKAAVAHALQTGEGYKLRLRLRRADGEIRWVMSHADTQKNAEGAVVALLGVFRDVTEQEHAHRTITASEHAFRTLAERTQDVIAVFGMDGTISYVSPAIGPLMGWTPEELVGRRTWDVMHPDDHGPIAAAYSDFIAAGPGAASPQLRYRGIRKDGSYTWLDAHPSILWSDDGRPLEIQDNIRDATETKRLEDDLKAERDRAEAAARTKTEFLANMSHELRTPLTSVIGFAGLLQKSEALGVDERRYVDRIATSSDALLGVINDILDYSKLEADAVGLDPTTFDPRGLVDAAAGIVESQCQEKGLVLVRELSDTLPPGLVGDEGRLRQVALNFLSNAVKFTSQGEVRIAARYEDERLRVAVSDTGIGISAEQASRLFRRFVQADASTTRTFGGTGLGLAISRRLIEMMGGEVGVDSRPGQGSTFWFEVPLQSMDAAERSADKAESIEVDRALRILMADDAPANRELVSVIMAGLGLSLDVVENGAEAVEAVRNGAYDLVLMDVHMPVMDGLMATQEIRAISGPTGQVPIIALTANVQPEQVAVCHAAGMDAHVGKPIHVAELMETISAVLDPSSAEEAVSLVG
ncbi:PAS domain-containing protein [Brevundimonas sp. A19_0]|uniref:PAS domain-containing protein n=1 Tax=Brevundimonas sp. A19_0 TaxID=2821087 RepID=UPI001ADC466A|nr:PAS domain-containing protein [Brevundimonas sp. A19_0]MBO9501082.1 PAS domain-containing protein [Brevundimonas sp. A19_0]